MIKKSFEKYSQDLGFKMFEVNEQILVEPKNLHDDQDDDEDDDNDGNSGSIWLRFFTGHNARINLKGSPLRLIDGKRYMFIHKLYQEYFTAQKIIEGILQLKSWPRNMNSLAQLIKRFSINVKLLNNEPPIILFLCDVLKSEQLKQKLRKRFLLIVEATKQSNSISNAAANAMTVLNTSYVCFFGIDFSNVKIKGALLDQAFLGNVDFSGADLTDVSLSQSNMAFLNQGCRFSLLLKKKNPLISLLFFSTF